MTWHWDGHPLWFEALPKPLLKEAWAVAYIIVSYLDASKKQESKVGKGLKKCGKTRCGLSCWPGQSPVYHQYDGPWATVMHRLVTTENEKAGRKICQCQQVLLRRHPWLYLVSQPQHERLYMIFLYLRVFGEDLLANWPINESFTFFNLIAIVF